MCRWVLALGGQPSPLQRLGRLPACLLADVSRAERVRATACRRAALVANRCCGSGAARRRAYEGLPRAAAGAAAAAAAAQHARSAAPTALNNRRRFRTCPAAAWTTRTLIPTPSMQTACRWCAQPQQPHQPQQRRRAAARLGSAPPSGGAPPCAAATACASPGRLPASLAALSGACVQRGGVQLFIQAFRAAFRSTWRCTRLTAGVQRGGDCRVLERPPGRAGLALDQLCRHLGCGAFWVGLGWSMYSWA